MKNHITVLLVMWLFITFFYFIKLIYLNLFFINLTTTILYDISIHSKITNCIN